jgi:hypothetical protein
MSSEELRLEEARKQHTLWRNWGPYLCKRQWGTVREDYGSGNDTWNYSSHDQARAPAYSWGEERIAGISDEQQRLCFAQPILSARSGSSASSMRRVA